MVNQKVAEALAKAKELARQQQGGETSPDWEPEDGGTVVGRITGYTMHLTRYGELWRVCLSCPDGEKRTVKVGTRSGRTAVSNGLAAALETEEPWRSNAGIGTIIAIEVEPAIILKTTGNRFFPATVVVLDDSMFDEDAGGAPAPAAAVTPPPAAPVAAKVSTARF